MKRPKDLDGLDLEDALAEIQCILYLDEDPSDQSPHPVSTAIWRSEKKDDADALRRIRELMKLYGLEPLRDEPFEDMDPF